MFSEPILKDFERDTGIRVRAVFSTEEAKSTGVMNRLLAEKDNPQADVYWANEPVRAELLEQRGVAATYESPNATGISAAFKDPDHFWTGFSARARVLVVNRGATAMPRSIADYANPTFRDRAANANPLFGTTTANVAALFTALGDEKAKFLLAGMKSNGVRITSSNGDSADAVASGECDFALVDSADVVNREKQGRPVAMVVPDQQEGEIGVLLLPNAALLLKGPPHSEQGRQFVDYLLSTGTEKKLAFADCALIPLHSEVETPPEVPRIGRLRIMAVSVPAVAREMELIQPYLKAWAGY